MDEKRSAGNAASHRNTTIPRPTSRLPLPRSAIPTPTAPSAVNATHSQPQSDQPRGRLPHSTTASNIGKPRLRTAPSREQLSNPSSQRKPQRSAAPPVTSRSALQDVKTRDRSLSRPRDTLLGSPSSHQDADHALFKRPAVPRRRPSGQFTQQPTLQEDTTSPVDDDQHSSSLPPLATAEEEGITFEDLMSSRGTPRPSLTERTIETLQQVSSSPANRRRQSNFEIDGSRRPGSKGSVGSRPGSRPGSSYQSDSMRSLSRPGSSSGPGLGDSIYGSFRASTNTYKAPLPTVYGTPSKRTSNIGSLKTPVGKTTTPKFTPRSSLSKMPSRSSLSASMGLRTPSPDKDADVPVSKYGSKTVSARPLRTRASMNELFKKPSVPSLNKKLSYTSELSMGPPRKGSLASAKSSSTHGESRNLSSASTVSTAATTVDYDDPSVPTNRKSSAALREQIAKAKAAKRAGSRQVSGATTVPLAQEVPIVPTDDAFDFGLSDDPFGQHRFESTNRKVMQSRIETARTSGRLNIAAMGLKEVPEDVLKMYELESIGRSDGTWAESVDLTRFVAADNQLETIDDAIFPDADPQDARYEDNGPYQIFGGLESMDLHGNMLISLPKGLRRLPLLTSLNLAANKLTNNCLDIISQVHTLRDLKLGNNLLYGNLEGSLADLVNLELLDLSNNSISSLPAGLENMQRLRILNLNENAFETLPFRSLSQLPLTELLVRKNKLFGTLIESAVESMPHLRILDCTANRLELLVDPGAMKTLHLPLLHQLSISLNRVKSLPDISSWSSLLTINADENSITNFPEGFTKLDSLRFADFTSNDIRVIPPEISRMEGLAMLRITGNPLRDKKFTSLTTEELKDALGARLEPIQSQETGGTEFSGTSSDRAGATSATITRPRASTRTTWTTANHEDDDDDDLFATPPTSAPHSPARSRAQTLSNQTWPVKTGGVLDRSESQSSSLHPVVCSRIAVEHTIREVLLHKNTFTQIPESLSFFMDTMTTLSISENQLTGENWLTSHIDLGALKELNLRQNFITSLTPLTTHLCAPNLEKMDVSLNRVVKLPALRDFFPSLTVLLVANNRLEDLDPESVKGMKIVDASNNELAHLNPRLGLLNLQRLDVTGNRFRVPRWNVLERGTEATLRWLRGRVPVVEMAEWKAAKNAEGGSDSADEVD
ncbi:hypothetical protein F4778DRAFT_787307 [Xylariomycetidae sp. FL2044]|nr:hypothetical protein F4778DRAFT_787307 [Xylariomycetidae sp. FL2044]